MIKILSNERIKAGSYRTGLHNTLRGHVRRVLIVSEERRSSATGLASPPCTLDGFVVDHACLDELGLSKGCGSGPAEELNAAGTCKQPSQGMPMLSQYLLILVPTDEVRRLLCNAMPGLAERIFQIDHFGTPNRPEHPTEHEAVRTDKVTMSSDLGHWSTCLSQLAI